jgi:hypothetical protein
VPHSDHEHLLVGVPIATPEQAKPKMKSRSAKPKKRGRGRPATGRDPMIGLRLPKAEIASLDKWAKANGYTRSEAIRMLVFRSLKG